MTVAHQAPLFMGFSRQEYCSELLFLSPGDLPNPGIEHSFPALQVDSLPSELPGMSCSSDSLDAISALIWSRVECESILHNLKSQM